MHVVGEKTERSLGAGILDWVRDKLSRFLGINHIEAKLNEYQVFVAEMAENQVKIATNAALTQRRLCWHEGHSEVLRQSAHSWKKHIEQQRPKTEGEIVADQIRGERKIHLLNDGKITA